MHGPGLGTHARTDVSSVGQAGEDRRCHPCGTVSETRKRYPANNLTQHPSVSRTFGKSLTGVWCFVMLHSLSSRLDCPVVRVRLSRMSFERKLTVFLWRSRLLSIPLSRIRARFIYLFICIDCTRAYRRGDTNKFVIRKRLRKATERLGIPALNYLFEFVYNIKYV